MKTQRQNDIALLKSLILTDPEGAPLKITAVNSLEVGCEIITERKGSKWKHTITTEEI